jgi:cell division transport system ATP-binding protein
VRFYNTLINDIPTKHLPYFRRNIGTVFQDFKLLPQKTVFENVSYALEVYGRSNEDIIEEVPQILEIVGLETKVDKFPYQLSGGEQQKVSLARALINRPKLIVADEPTGNLDPDSTWEIVDLLLKINDFGTTVILATHDKQVVDEINRRVVVMSDGAIIRDEIMGKYDNSVESVHDVLPDTTLQEVAQHAQQNAPTEHSNEHMHTEEGNSDPRYYETEGAQSDPEIPVSVVHEGGIERPARYPHSQHDRRPIV